MIITTILTLFEDKKKACHGIALKLLPQYKKSSKQKLK
ncbi:hypothetical protein BN193_05100 [Lactococcus raffinolactis 4877]|nr:hypothetical protein BN193_05100 [Lactococcus raffinolactis 4877]